MNKKIISFIELARLDKPIGIYLLLWPSLLGLLLGAIQSQTIDFINKKNKEEKWHFKH